MSLPVPLDSPPAYHSVPTLTNEEGSAPLPSTQDDEEDDADDHTPPFSSPHPYRLHLLSAAFLLILLALLRSWSLKPFSEAPLDDTPSVETPSLPKNETDMSWNNGTQAVQAGGEGGKRR